MAKAAETAVAEQKNDDRAEKQHGKDSQQSDEESAAAFKNGFQCGSESEDSTENEFDQLEVSDGETSKNENSALF